MASYFQGAYRANLAFTLRVTHVADGSTSDFSMAVGDTYDSVDQALTAINAQCVADLGAAKVTFAKSGSSANKYSDSISVTTGGATWPATTRLTGFARFDAAGHPAREATFSRWTQPHKRNTRQISQMSMWRPFCCRS